MLRRLSLHDFVIVDALELELDPGYSALTGETGAGKSILIDALQLALGARGEAGVVREGASRAEIGAEFESPPALAGWLEDGGFEPSDSLLLRRTIDAQGKSRAWINGRFATVTQLREAAEHLVEIHGQHAWQRLTRPAAVRALLDAYAGIDATSLAARHAEWRRACDALEAAGSAQGSLDRERERLTWQIGEVDKLAPADGEWADLEAEHKRLSNGQALIDAARGALEAISEADDNADALAGRAVHRLEQVADIDPRLAATVEVLQGAQVQLQDAAHTLTLYLHEAEPDPERLGAVDERLGAWLSLARRHRRRPEELPAVLEGWRDELRALDASADLDALAAARDRARSAFDAAAKAVSTARAAAAPRLASAISAAMQQLGMTGGRFEVALVPQPEPQSFGAESAEFRVAGHAGSTPRPLAKVASGGELSRIALAIAVTTSRLEGSADAAGTLIFDEIDAGVGGAVAETVGRLMKQLGHERQVLAVTHLPQVAACADHHWVVSKRLQGGGTRSDVRPVADDARVDEVARMLGGERISDTSRAHARELIEIGAGRLPDKPPLADAPARARRRA